MFTAWLKLLAGRVSERARRARNRQLLDFIAVLSAEGRVRRILDMGGRASCWRAFGLDELRRLGAHVTIVNAEPEPAPAEADVMAFVTGDACDLSGFADGAFDLVHSNSVIEHVGDDARQEAFAREARRLAPACYVQTPYFWFPIEPHFLSLGFHWLPERVRVRKLMRRDYGHHRREETEAAALATVRSARLLTRRRLAALFPDAGIVEERILGLVKSIIAVRRAAAG